jgi:hypothetical protein
LIVATGAATMHPDPIENAILLGMLHLIYHIERTARAGKLAPCRFCDRRTR